MKIVKRRKFFEQIEGNILKVRVLEEVRVGGVGEGQVRYRNPQLDVLNLTIYHTWRCGFGNTPNPLS
jgi:hypothetical protein